MLAAKNIGLDPVYPLKNMMTKVMTEAKKMSKFSTPSPSPLTNHTKLSGSVPETCATFTEMSSLSLYPLNCVDPDQLASGESIYCFPCSLMKLN